MNTILLKILLIFIKHDKTLSIPARDGTGISEWIRNTSECKIQANYSIKKIKSKWDSFFNLPIDFLIFLQRFDKKRGMDFTNKRYNKTGSRENMCERCKSRLYSGRFANWHISKKKPRRNTARDRAAGLKWSAKTAAGKRWKMAGKIWNWNMNSGKRVYFKKKLYVNVGSVCRDIGGRFFM